jgi:hypothetical protein
MSKTIIATMDVDGAEITIVDRAGSLRLESEGVDVGPVRGTKRLAGPQICSSQKRSAEVYAQLSKAVCRARFAQGAS